MLKGIDLNEKIRVVSTEDKGDNPTLFFIGNVKHSDKMRLFSGAIDKAGEVDISKLQDRALDILKIGLKEIKNLDGRDYTTITDDVIDSISFNVVMELVGKILEYNFLGKGEVKN